MSTETISISKTKRVRNILLLIAIGGSMVWGFYFLISSFVLEYNSIEQQQLKYLEGIANTVATQISPADHQYLLENYRYIDAIESNIQDSVYLELHDKLRQIKNANKLKPEIKFIILRSVASRNIENSAFITCTSADKPEFRHLCTPPLKLIQFFNQGGIANRYNKNDKNYVAAFSPVKKENNEVEAIVFIEQSVESFLDEEKQKLIRKYLILTFISIIYIGILFLAIRRITGTLMKQQQELSKRFTKINTTFQHLRKFVDKIGRGNLDAKMDFLDLNDALGISLINMQDSLKKANKEREERQIIEKQQKWISDGIAHFNDLLRKTNDIEDLSDLIISNLVKYLNANQGGIFLKEVKNSETTYELKAAYAYDHKKYHQKTVYERDGLLGTCAVEKSIIILTDIPENYLEISSGMGEAPPKILVMCPLVFNNEVFGLIELASFHLFEKYQIDFLEKVGQGIASSISTMQINQQTSILLAQSKDEEKRNKKEENILKEKIKNLEKKYRETLQELENQTK